MKIELSEEEAGFLRGLLKGHLEYYQTLAANSQSRGMKAEKLGFIEGLWEKLKIRSEKGASEMAKKEKIEDPSKQKGEKGGSPRKVAYHEGEAGRGDLGGRKFAKEGRDSEASEKELGKSRGPGG